MKSNLQLLCLVSSVLTMGLSGCSQAAQNTAESELKSRDIFAMDTYMTVSAAGEKADEALDAAVKEIQRLDALWSVGNEDSEIAILNREGEAELSEETGALLERSLQLYQSTNGVFDISVYPLMEAWGFTTGEFRVPSQEEIDELLAYVDAGALEYEAGSGTMTLPEGMQVDLGGIAKGYTSSRVMEIYEAYGITSGLVSLGGNVQTFHTRMDGNRWRIGIQNPDRSQKLFGNDDYVAVVEVADQAVITSGGYERYFEEGGVTYHHILDPSTGCPAKTGLLSVSIISADGTLADGLSTSLFIMGQEKGLDYWRAHSEEFDVIFVDDEGRITITGGLKESFTSNYKYTVVSE